MPGISRLAEAAAIPEDKRNDTPFLYRMKNVPPPLNSNQG